jgi:hypothetical protein
MICQAEFTITYYSLNLTVITLPQESDVASIATKERNGEAPLGYSGRTALRWEQCNVDDKALLGNDPVKQQWKGSNRCYAVTQYTCQQWRWRCFLCGWCGGDITSMKPFPHNSSSRTEY